MNFENLLKRIVLAAKIDDELLKSNLNVTDKEKVKELNNKLTNKVKYVNYLIKNFKEKEIVELLNKFDKNVNKYKQKDINSYSINELKKVLEEPVQKSKTELKSSGAKLIFENDKVFIYHILTEAASKLYGKGTKWCVSGEKDNKFNEYDEEINLYFIISKYRDKEDPLYKIAVAVYSNILEIFNAEDKKIGESKVKEEDVSMSLFLQNKEHLKNKILSKFISENKLKKNEDGSYDCDKDLDVDNRLVENGKFIIRFNKINGNFYCGYAQLITLENGPKEVKGEFDCSHNKLTSLKYCPKEVNGGFYCSNNELTSLEYCSEIINGRFNCNDNKLTTLDGCPEIINGYFLCNNNKLTSLEGCPKKVNGYFECYQNSKQFTEEDVRKVCDVKGKIFV
jgi:hypothetical protein